MALTLDEYADHLDTRDLPWPAPPVVERPKARPHLAKLDGIQAILWNVYGTLIAISEGQLIYEHSQAMINEIVLEKTVEEFKMWGSMARKPGQPSDYLRDLFKRAFDELKLTSGNDKYPELPADKIWDNIIKKLMQKEYKFDAAHYGSINQYTQKIAYFYHASLQGTGAYPGAADALNTVNGLGIRQGVLADGQCFTLTQLARGLRGQDSGLQLDDVLATNLRFLSYAHKAKKPSETLFKAAMHGLRSAGIDPSATLHVGSSLERDIGPAKKLGMRTALFAGDRASLVATPDKLKDPAFRPDVMLTELSQIAEVVG
jgi:FMN phosphatase YigB (HAD superfamily)